MIAFAGDMKKRKLAESDNMSTEKMQENFMKFIKEGPKGGKKPEVDKPPTLPKHVISSDLCIDEKGNINYWEILRNTYL